MRTVELIWVDAEWAEGVAEDVVADILDLLKGHRPLPDVWRVVESVGGRDE